MTSSNEPVQADSARSISTAGTGPIGAAAPAAGQRGPAVCALGLQAAARRSATNGPAGDGGHALAGYSRAAIRVRPGDHGRDPCLRSGRCEGGITSKSGRSSSVLLAHESRSSAQRAGVVGLRRWAAVSMRPSSVSTSRPRCITISREHVWVITAVVARDHQVLGRCRSRSDSSRFSTSACTEASSAGSARQQTGSAASVGSAHGQWPRAGAARPRAGAGSGRRTPGPADVVHARWMRPATSPMPWISSGSAAAVHRLPQVQRSRGILEDHPPPRGEAPCCPAAAWLPVGPCGWLADVRPKPGRPPAMQPGAAQRAPRWIARVAPFADDAALAGFLHLVDRSEAVVDPQPLGARPSGAARRGRGALVAESLTAASARRVQRWHAARQSGRSRPQDPSPVQALGHPRMVWACARPPTCSRRRAPAKPDVGPWPKRSAGAFAQHHAEGPVRHPAASRPPAPGYIPFRRSRFGARRVAHEQAHMPHLQCRGSRWHTCAMPSSGRRTGPDPARPSEGQRRSDGMPSGGRSSNSEPRTRRARPAGPGWPE